MDRKAHPNFMTVWLHERAMSNDKNRTGTRCIIVLTAVRFPTIISVL